MSKTMTMSFELVDNLLQVMVMGASSVAALVLSARYQSRSLLMLALGYACFCMGTLYYVLCLAVTGDVPQVFYVSEISWIAAYLFFLSVQIVRMGDWDLRVAGVPALCAGVVVATSLASRAMGPSYLTRALFTVVMGAIAYLAAFRLWSCRHRRWFDACLLGCVGLQLLVYLTSEFIRDYSSFNAYFAVDIALTICLATLLPLRVRELTRA